MLNKLNIIKQSILVTFSLLISFQFITAEALENQHSIEVLTNILQEPISDKAEKAARDFDDELMSNGQALGSKIYLVTDERSNSVNNIVAKLLNAMGEISDNWVVRVLNTDEPVVNAFVTGGKYIYVFTGLMKQVTSEDELAFVLSHELGHSLLKHNERRKEDISTSIAGIAKLIGMLSKKKSKQFYNDFAKITVASYGRLDEEEADAIGSAIARRAGYNPLKGADFFSRSEHEKERNKLEKEKINLENQQILEKAKNEAYQSHSVCQQATQQFKSRWIKTTKRADEVNAICSDAESKKLTYLDFLKQSINMSAQERSNSAQGQSNSFFSTHPQDQNRVAVIAALTDYFNSRRDLDSLLKFKQTYHVMSALNNVNSVLLEPIEESINDITNVPETTSNNTSNLTAQLDDLKKAYEKKLITNLEYEKKRHEILNFK
ncbi:MAG: M48 family metallopeptidase [Methylotenera sp.]|nr:M48 family metallopeptidase [Methylotenera sp.]